MTPFDIFTLQLDRIKRDLRTTRQTFTKTTNPRTYPDPLPEGWHGSTNGYVTYKCRCHECRQAMAYYSAERRAIRNQARAIAQARRQKAA